MKRVALIGSPLKRRHSEVMHNAAFERFGIDAHYELVELVPNLLDQFFEDARRPDWLGFQVTAPYKQEAAARCDEVEKNAARIGAVNSVVRRDDGSLLGFNTDAPGFRRAVESELGFDFGGAGVVVAGAGGAARAVAVAALEAGASVVVGSRRKDAATELVGGLDAPKAEAAALGADFDHALETADLAVNATTVGMTSPGTPFDVAHLPDGAAVFDLVYLPPLTELLSDARARGLPAAGGGGMLVSQAEIAFERWTGVAGAGETMAIAVRPLLEAGGDA